MSDNESIKVSKIVFWALTAVGAVVLAGFAGWISSTNSTLNKMQIDMATIVATVSNLERRVEDNLNISNKVNQLDAQIQLLDSKVARNTRYIENAEGVRFDISDYEKYVKPPIDSLLDRVNKLEHEARLK